MKALSILVCALVLSGCATGDWGNLKNSNPYQYQGQYRAQPLRDKTNDEAASVDPCNCHGYAGPDGPCYAGPGGAAYNGAGGPQLTRARAARLTPTWEADNTTVRADLSITALAGRHMMARVAQVTRVREDPATMAREARAIQDPAGWGVAKCLQVAVMEEGPWTLTKCAKWWTDGEPHNSLRRTS
jgi:hypothetical protein